MLTSPTLQRQAPYPVVVGHEIIGEVVRVGSKAEGGLRVGDVVGVGAQSDACLNRDSTHSCLECDEEMENYCTRLVGTYASHFFNGDKTFGGYARYHRCPSHFVIKIPDGLAPEFAAPMLCAGVTTYSPLKHFGAGPGKKVGVVGVGGLGHFAVLFAKALGADEVVGISRRASKRQEALDLGCTDYIATEDDKDWQSNNARRLDLIISTVSSPKVRLKINSISDAIWLLQERQQIETILPATTTALLTIYRCRSAATSACSNWRAHSCRLVCQRVSCRFDHPI